MDEIDRDRLRARLREKIEALRRETSTPFIEGADQLQQWAVELTREVAGYLRASFGPGSAAEQALLEAAKSWGMGVRWMEDPEQQRAEYQRVTDWYRHMLRLVRMESALKGILLDLAEAEAQGKTKDITTKAHE